MPSKDKPKITLLIPAKDAEDLPALQGYMRALVLVDVTVVVSDLDEGWSLLDEDGEVYEADYTTRGVVRDAFRQLALR